MIKRELSDDIVEAIEADAQETVTLLGRFNVGEYWEKDFHFRERDNPQNTTRLMNYVKRLRQEGLDIGDGESQFGYKMPLPKKYATQRVLQIFRRR